VKLLALDFDGVISDSAREAFAVARRTHLELRPHSTLESVDEARLYAAFLALVPLGNRAEDYGTALAAIEAGVDLPDQEAYDRFRAAQDPAWLDAFHARFYEVRDALSEADREGWLATLCPYPRFVALLRRRAGDCEYAIATSKDRRSVGILLAHYGIADLFAPELVLDKEAGVSKAAHLRELARARGLGLPEITFVDDKVNHLDHVAPLGVRCALAAWGYNGPREHRLARARGYLVCTLDDAEAQLFGARTARRGASRADANARSARRVRGGRDRRPTGGA
jgi:phosphoglycolate phosphatase-like HAD superfamily hydrolase